MRYGLKLGAAAVGLLVLAVLGFVIFDAIWARIGLGAAIAVVAGSLVLLAWRMDQKTKESRARLEQL